MIRAHLKWHRGAKIINQIGLTHRSSFSQPIIRNVKISILLNTIVPIEREITYYNVIFVVFHS